MPSGYTADEQSAAKIAGLIADSPTKITAGTVTKVTSQTTAVVTHGLGSTPDFVLYNVQADAGTSALLFPSLLTGSTTVTFTINTAQANWTVAYIIGYTA